MVERLDACRLLASRTPQTLACYRWEYASLLRRSDPPPEVDDRVRLVYAIDWFGDQHEAWQRASIRLYSAALRQAIVDLDGAIRLDPSDADALHSALDRAAPRPCDKKITRTSAKKRKTLPLEEFALLLEDLRGRSDATSALLAGALYYGVVAGVRPAEWANARRDGNLLVISCAKTTNGRSVGKERELELVDWSEEERWDLDDFLAAYREARADAGGKRLHQRLAKALARACDRVGIRPVSLYTLRHQCLATAKRFLSTAEVAAQAGHATEVTATRGYARRQGGWNEPPRLVRPTAQVVERVRRGKTAYKPDDRSPALK